MMKNASGLKIFSDAFESETPAMLATVLECVQTKIPDPQQVRRSTYSSMYTYMEASDA